MSAPKPKIGIIHYTYPPVIGGVENLILTHANYFANHGYSVTVFVSEGESNNKNVHLNFIPELASLAKSNSALRQKIISDNTYPTEFYTLSKSILASLEKYKDTFDILFAHNIFSLTFNPAIAHALITFQSLHPEKKIVAWTHDVLLNDRETNPKKRTYPNKEFENMLNSPIEGIHYVCISSFLKNTFTNLLGFSENRLTVIPNAIDIHSFLQLHPLTQKIIADNNLLESDAVLFFPSKIMPHKNIELCLDALFELKKKLTHPIMIISAKKFPHVATSSTYVQEIEERIKKLDLSNNVLFISDELKALTPDEVMHVISDIYKLSDIALYPSKYENFGLPILESAITKTPIICSQLEVFQEVSDDKIYVIDNTTTTSTELSHIMITILTNDKEISLFRRVKNQFDISQVFRKKIVPYIDSLNKAF
ncbi:MAG: glycosyltransferase family 4 protein [Candidatus Roizmanbacteria bacterium]|nr:glycosyltransferase family 4 protein [Candidatus Roizmanbacteria bacterium]